MRGADFDRLARASQQAVERDAAGRADPEPSLGARLGQIGVLGWAIIVPTLLFRVTRTLARPQLRNRDLFFRAHADDRGRDRAVVGLEMDASPGGQAAMTALTFGFAAQAAFGFVAGLVVGVAYFASLWWNTRLFTTGSSGRAIALQFGRIAAAVAILILLARLSLVTLLFGAFGFLIARFSLLWGLGAQR